MKCKKCGKEFESNGYSSLCEKCRIESKSNLFYYIGFIVIIVGFILGIAAGNTNKILNDKNELVFNAVIMFYYWVLCVCLSIIPIGFGAVCKRLNILINNKK